MDKMIRCVLGYNRRNTRFAERWLSRQSEHFARASFDIPGFETIELSVNGHGVIELRTLPPPAVGGESLHLFRHQLAKLPDRTGKEG